jgi:acyl-CoA thioesterase-1
MTERLGSLFISAYGAATRIGKAGVLAIALAVPAFAQEVTVVALGDSLTQGFGLIEEDGFVPQLQGWLEAQGNDVVVENHGVSGDTTAGGLARIGWALGDHVDALIVALGAMTCCVGCHLRRAARTLTGYWPRQKRGACPSCWSGWRRRGTTGRTTRPRSTRCIPSWRCNTTRCMYRASSRPLTEAAEDDRAGALARYMQPDGIHPNADGVALIVEALGPEVEALIERIEPQS